MTETDKARGEKSPQLYPLKMSNVFNPAQVLDCLDNITASLRLGLPQFVREGLKKGALIIVGGGPSLAGEIEALRELDTDENRVLCVNDVHDFILDHGIKPWGMIYMEIGPWEEGRPPVREPIDGVKYLLSSCSNPINYDFFKDADILQWHAWNGLGTESAVRAVYPDSPVLGGGGTSGLRAINLGIAAGWHRFHLFGMDSSFEDQTHAYADRPATETEIVCAGRTFKTQPRLAKQAKDFRELCMKWHAMFDLVTHGDGLLQHIHRTQFPSQYAGEMAKEVRHARQSG